MNCPSCTVAVPEDSLSCPSCGASLEESFAPTRILPEGPKSSSGGGRAHPGQLPTRRSYSASSIHDSIDHARFIAGTMLGERYRIVGLLGRGGMGEVYKAEDLALGQPVALKFLPESLTADGAALARFHREVKIARQISHRNVCRVYDIGDAEGLHFLSMEFIKGEELSSVLKRFGRLPAGKAAEIARQICAGLAAAHEAGVLHRDLKPANVMIDENGNVRVMDFGLAGLAEEFRGQHAVEGTPEYMSPEQLAGKELTVRSDIYSLGLVLYEIFTGKKAFTANSLPELLSLRKSVSSPESPSTLVKDIDPLVERLIERCLAADPQERPQSALQVAAALPGGDPLAAALAAGETPSPEMVAAAPKQGSLRPAVAAALLALSLAACATAVLLSGKIFLHNQVPLDKSAQGLKERAAEIAKKFGYDAATDAAGGFETDGEYLRYVKEHDPSPARWEKLKTGRPVAVEFWYRQSPRYLVPLSRREVTATDPPWTVSGMAGVALDTRGRLLRFQGVPPQVVGQQQGTPAAAASFDWSAFFTEAGLDPLSFKQSEPKWVPPHPFDTQAAWEGVYPDNPDIPVRVEAAAFRGRPVYFQVVNPWNRPSMQEQFQERAGEKALQVVGIALFALILTGAALLARRNLRLGRGDRKGAFRLAAFAFLLCVLLIFLRNHHVPALEREFGLFLETLAYSLLQAVMIWLIYIALEPFVRRRWPARIIAWNRLLAGDYRDPLVGRDLLLGALFGFGFMLIDYLQFSLPRWLGWAPATPAVIPMNELSGPQYLASMLIAQVLNALVFPSVLLFLFLLFSIILRREWAAVGAILLLFSSLSGLEAEHPALGMLVGAIGAALTLCVLLRFGLLALVFTQFFTLMFYIFPITTDFSAWYAGGTIFSLVVGVSLILYGFHTSLAGQPLFRGPLVED